MKIPSIVGAVAAMFMAGAVAQDFESTAPSHKVPMVHTEVQQRPSINGIVAEIFNVKKPWQLVNPAAPKEYGDGRKMVSYSEKEPGKPKGFIVFGFEW